MNTAQSVAYGWVVLIVAAGGAYYYAKKDIDQRRRENFRNRRDQSVNKMSWEQRLEMQEASLSQEEKDAKNLKPSK